MKFPIFYFIILFVLLIFSIYFCLSPQFWVKQTENSILYDTSCIPLPSLLLLGSSLPESIQDAECSNVSSILLDHTQVANNTKFGFLSLLGKPGGIKQFYYMPTCQLSKADIIYCMAPGPSTTWALSQKESSPNDTLVYLGPNAMPDNFWSRVDYNVVPSQIIVNTFIHKFPNNNFCAWPAGIDTQRWAPNKNVTRDSVLIYIKNNAFRTAASLISAAKNFSLSLGYKVIEIVYTKYNQAQFLDSLQRSALAIFFTETESQGFALFETWSTDVPTFVWVGKMGLHEYQGWIIFAHPAPYLSSETGTVFSNSVQLFELLKLYKANTLNFSPRHWVLENGSFEKCGKTMWEKMKKDWLIYKNASKYCEKEK